MFGHESIRIRLKFHKIFIQIAKELYEYSLVANQKQIKNGKMNYNQKL